MSTSDRRRELIAGRWRVMTSIRQTSVPLPINLYERSGDVESGRTTSGVHTHVFGKLPSGCEYSSSSRVTPPSLQSTAAVSPHSRFIDGFKRRARLDSLNVPVQGHEVLDMGFLPVTPRNGYNGGQSSPRHPLYVDTQLANSIGEKRRSPATTIVDFIRGRSCATSQSLSGLATPPSPTTASVSARASASTDGGVPTSPLFSPVRGNSRLHLSRVYHPGMRSLDSGLDLSSPTIGQHALLIKEVFLM
uniref:Uncharacterized protein n=1 Tax=Angiostrongylus cantonensis TaxID=6313 RepID=A0A0K0DCY8_ANGCA